MKKQTQKQKLPISINLTKNDTKIGKLIKNDVKHQLKVSITIKSSCTDVYLDFTSREALYDFALSLLYASIYNIKHRKKYVPVKNKNEEPIIIDGVRLSLDSCSIVISWKDILEIKKDLPTNISLTPDGDEIGMLIYDDGRHQLKVSISNRDNCAYLDFTSKEALYDFAVSLLNSAVYDEVRKEYLPEHMPREEDGTIPVIDGVRMTDDSARLFIFWNDDEC